MKQKTQRSTTSKEIKLKAYGNKKEITYTQVLSPWTEEALWNHYPKGTLQGPYIEKGLVKHLYTERGVSQSLFV